jgi:RNA polymerase sigma-70 factor (ECF subfamily)
VGLSTQKIWEDFRAPLRGFIRRRVKDDHVADDLLQEAFLKIHNGIGSLKDDQRLTAWLYRIARNTITDHFRKHPFEELNTSNVEDRTKEVDVDSSKKLATCLNQMVTELPRKYRQAIELAELQGTTQRQMAGQLGLSVSGAKSRVQRGREQLKQMLVACCDIELDSRRKVLNYEPRDANASRGCNSGACG